MSLAEVHTLYETNCRAIPDMLRQAAGAIETEADEGFAPTTAIVAVQIAANGQVQVYGWGDTSNVHAMGMLHLGLQNIGGMILDRGDGGS